MEYLGWFAVGFLGIRFLVALFNLITRPYLPIVEAEADLTVSILIPARNEAENIPKLLRSLCQSSYKKHGGAGLRRCLYR